MYAAIKRLLVLIVCFNIAGCACAQQYIFKNYTAVNGLGSNIVNQVFQDSRGYIWFATQGGGAGRFDGTTFKNFTSTDGLISNNVTCFAEDKHGNIWIGTEAGASKFDGDKLTNFNSKDGLTSNTIYAIYAANDDKIWFATGGDGIRIFDGHKFDSITKKNGLSSNRVFNIAVTQPNTYWFGLGNGIVRYNGKVITRYDSVTFVHGNTFFSSLADSKGNVWFGCIAGGIVKFNGKEFEKLSLPAYLKDDPIGALAEDKTGAIWFATNHGIIKYSENTFKQYSEKEGLSINTTLSVMADRTGNLWIGTQDGGACLFRSEAFVTYTDKQGLANNNVVCLYADTVKNANYVGTAKAGLYILNTSANSKFKAITGIDKIKDINSYCLAVDAKGKLWIGADNGMYVLNKTVKGFDLKASYADIQSVTKIMHDAMHDCWASSFGGGIYHIHDTVIKNYTKKSGSLSDNILTLFEDSKLNIWAGTQDAGVLKFDGTGFKSFLPPGDFTDKTVWAITEDEDGNIYFGTGGRGIYRYDGKTLRKYSVDDNLCSNSVTALLWDKHQHCLWLGSATGINKIKFGSTGNIVSLRNYAGIVVNSNAIQTDSAGLVWFGSPNGLYCYNNKYDAPVSSFQLQLAGISLNNKQVNWHNYADSIDPVSKLPVGLRLAYSNNHLLFKFQALTTDNVKYTYILEGQDTTWSPLSPVNEANYTNILPGRNYTFKVRAMNGNGTWCNEVPSFSFSIAPPWWQTWWFRISVLISATVSLVAFIKAREKVLKDQNIKLEKTVTERTAEIVKEKKYSDDLLLNILPTEVAEELKLKGSAEAKFFDNVTVLFTDFKSFTTLSEKLTPHELVNELHVCFSAFDAITERYGIEKIKTIGDAYLAVCGLPAKDDLHAEKMVRAAIEIRDFVLNRRQQLGEQTFEIRLGVHSGSLVAGIVGIKKYAYDIWGDTVNTAARMEQNGVPGKINVSQATYELVKDKFSCVPRGEIEAKNKGKLHMYFVENLT